MVDDTKLDTSRVMIVSTHRGLNVLKVWLADRRYNDVFPWLTDKAGNRMIGLNWKNEGTKQFERSGLVVVRDLALLDDVLSICTEGKTNGAA